mmetsp:Transcript_4251/g.11880  ORF Transcript_4251/g.11880 Transcript_4251/m.11880 type:complete len:242 (+) Transcript_4251:34-759(+)
MEGIRGGSMVARSCTVLRFAILAGFLGWAVGVGSDLPGDGPECVKVLVERALHGPLACLTDYKLEVLALEGDYYYLRTAPDPQTAALPPKRRTYDLFANPVLCNASGPSEEALYAIVIHELNHILDYTQLGITQFAEFGIQYATNYPFQIWYEHATDYRVLELDLGHGLADYRKWIYGVLPDEEAICQKKLEYYTPKQIAAYQLEHPFYYQRACPPDYTFHAEYPGDCFGTCHYTTNCSAV